VIPALSFEVTGARDVRHAAAPTVAFTLSADDPSGREIYTVALTVQLQIVQGVTWAQQQVLVPSFRGSVDFELVVPCNADLELATARYFAAVPARVAPIAFHFSGSVFYSDDDDRLKLTQVSWDSTARYEMPLDVWHAATAGRGGVVRVAADTFAALRREQEERGLPTIDAVVAELLAVRAP
jgi:hypothetical protein